MEFKLSNNIHVPCCHGNVIEHAGGMHIHPLAVICVCHVNKALSVTYVFGSIIFLNSSVGEKT